MTSNVIFSESGEVHGYGSDWYKWVSKLTPTEQAAVKSGEVVVIVKAARPSGGGNRAGTYYRQVTYTPCYGYGHRVPSVSDEVIDNVRYGE